MKNQKKQKKSVMLKKQATRKPDLVKDFHRIRRYLEQFAIYGINDIEDYQKKFNIGERSFQVLWRQTEKWLEKGTFAIPSDEEIVKKNKGRRIISADSREFSCNPLYNVFRMKSFTDKDLLLYFVIFDFLAAKLYKNEENFAFFDEISEYIQSILDYVPEKATVQSKLDEYCELGLIKTEIKDGNTVYFIENMPDFYGWENALFFYSEIFPLGIIGHYINCFHLPDEKSPFFYKHHYLFPALASQIMYVLINAINSSQKVMLSISKNYMKQDKPDEEETEVLPIKFYIGTRSGREYLLYRNCSDDAFKFIRLDHIYNVEIKSIAKDYDKAKAKAKDFEQSAWGVSCSDTSKVHKLQMELEIADDEQYVLQRLKRERRKGKIKKTGKNTYLYSAEAYDCMEMLSWIRTFICRIKNISCTQPDVIKELNKSIKESCKKYGVAKK